MRNRGFTLIELLVVVVIIVILVALLAPALGLFGGSTYSGMVSEKWTDAENNHIFNLVLPDGEIRQVRAWTNEYNSVRIGQYYEISVTMGNVARTVKPLPSPVQPPVEVLPEPPQN